MSLNHVQLLETKTNLHDHWTPTFLSLTVCTKSAFL